MISDTHAPKDDRIYWKESLTLRNNGFDVVHICVGAQQEEYCTDEGVNIIQLARRKYARHRIANKICSHLSRRDVYREILQKAAAEQASVYHLHDLKLLKLADRLKALPWKPAVIYDVHDPFAQNIIDYHSGGSVAERWLYRIYAIYVRSWQYRKAQGCDMLIFTEEILAEQFKNNISVPSEIVYNYTDLAATERVGTRYDVVYSGSITRFRGAMQILHSAKICAEADPRIRFLIVGTATPPDLADEMQAFVQTHRLEANVEICPAVPYSSMSALYAQCRIGLGIFLPIPTHHIIMPIKTFEYMHSGLPIVASNFGHIGRIVQEEEAGLTVHPTSPEAIAMAILRLHTDSALYHKCSANGKAACQSRYRWELMEPRLLSIYARLTYTH